MKKDSLISNFDIDVLQNVFTPCLGSLSLPHDTLSVAGFQSILRVFSLKRGQKFTWCASVEPTIIRRASIGFSATIYMSPGPRQAIYRKIAVEQSTLSVSGGSFSGEFCAQHDGILVLKFSNRF